MNRTCIVILLLSLLPLLAVLGDGDARLATQREKDFTVNVRQTLERAVPAPSAGWVIVEKTEIAAPEWVSVGTENEPFQVEYRHTWQHPDRIEEARMKEEQIIGEMAASMRERQDNMVETTRKLDELSAAMNKAREVNDREEVKRIQRLMEELAEQYNEGASQGKTAEERQKEIQPRDVRVRFIARVNAMSFNVSRYRKEADVSGYPVYRREYDGLNESMEGEYVVFAGDFTPKSYENEVWMELTPRREALSTSAQSIILVIAGEKTHTRRLLESMDWAALKIMMTNS
ncbi:hypothetical protein JXA80_14395 [bacterium]|nr:hypothetical protein [candidate division CSSED10-310 bacterium]